MIASGASPTEGASAGTRVPRVVVDVFAIAACGSQRYLVPFVCCSRGRNRGLL